MNPLRLAVLPLAVACTTPAAEPALDHDAQSDSLRVWARAIETAFDRFEGCGGGDAARALYANDGAVFTTDSATMVLDGEVLTGMFQSVACTRRESAFALDSVVVRSVAQGVGVVTATYIETATDTANVTNRLRGAVTWVVQRSDSGWKAISASVTEHRTRIK